MYQVFNVEKNRWQKFDKNGKLLGTKRTEGPYVKIPLKSEEVEEVLQTKTIHEWLVAEKMELLSDNGILKSIGLTEQSKISFTKYAEIVPKLSVRNLW